MRGRSSTLFAASRPDLDLGHSVLGLYEYNGSEEWKCYGPLRRDLQGIFGES